MKRILLIILLLTPLFASAQRMEITEYKGFKYLSLYSYGLPRSVVKTNSEMRNAQLNGDGTGIAKRHHTTKAIDERIGDQGYACNDKLSFGYIIAPYNVNKEGEHVTDSGVKMTWAEASGWDTAIDTEGTGYDIITGVGIGASTLAPTPTGCAAYTGPDQQDKPGTWRLPTQREMQVMFTVIEQAFASVASGEVEHQINEGAYWTSTEFYSSQSPGNAWSMNSITGRPLYELKTEPRMVRCVKDIYDPINE